MTAKRVFDLSVSTAGLVCLSPVLLVIAIAILLEGGGGPFFLQERVGLRGRRFMIVKFRTMRPARNGEVRQITVGADPRITKLGYFLRKSKLDELPQLWNVLKGEMSLVGPRPEVPTYMDQYTAEQRNIILSVRPGITDFAAIEFRDESEILAKADDPEKAYVEDIMPRKFAFYERYVEQRSFFLDLSLIVRTIIRVVA